jgi:hypothetical protein
LGWLFCGCGGPFCGCVGLGVSLAVRFVALILGPLNGAGMLSVGHCGGYFSIGKSV